MSTATTPLHRAQAPATPSGVKLQSAAVPLLSVHLSAGYGDVTTLQDVVLQVRAGERVGIVGSSGAGKSTLAMAGMGLLPWRGGWAKGKLLFEGDNLLSLSERQWRALRGKRLALVPQSPSSALNPSLSLQRHFEEAWRAHSRPDAKALHTRMQTLLQRVGLPVEVSFLNRRPAQISIGQAQRILIGLALLHGPSLLVADEPTSALDVVNQADMLRLLDELSREQGMALLYISHDLISVVQMCDRMVVLSGGMAVETLACDALDMRMTYHPATRRLLATLPVAPELLRRHKA